MHTPLRSVQAKLPWRHHTWAPVLIVTLILLAGCSRIGGENDATDNVTSGATERSVVVDHLLDGGSRLSQQSVSVVEASERLAPNRTPPKGATQLSVGDIVILAPVQCGAVAYGDTDDAPDCDPTVLRSGTLDGRQFLSALTFDLSDLPLGSEVLYGALELTGLDDEFLADYGRWYIRMVDMPEGVTLGDMSFADIAESPPVDTDAVWRLHADALESRGIETLRFEGVVLDELALRLGNGTVTFRIDGPTGRTNMFSWPADGPDAPRLRIGYVAMPDDVEADPEPLVIWDDR